MMGGTDSKVPAFDLLQRGNTSEFWMSACELANAFVQLSESTHVSFVMAHFLLQVVGLQCTSMRGSLACRITGVSHVSTGAIFTSGNSGESSRRLCLSR